MNDGNPGVIPLLPFPVLRERAIGRAIAAIQHPNQTTPRIRMIAGVVERLCEMEDNQLITMDRLALLVLDQKMIIISHDGREEPLC